MNQTRFAAEDDLSEFRTRLRNDQLERLNAILPAIRHGNRFWGSRLHGVKLPLASWEDWRIVPLTTKEDLSQTAAEDPSALLTFASEEYVRVHRTSGSRGAPLCVYDTAADWKWWTDTWQYTLDAAEVAAGDRAALAFSFGPFIGFWSAHAALANRGALVIPSGGMSSPARLEFFRQVRPTVLLATPTYALRLHEIGQQQGIDCRQLGIRVLIVAGEPGGSLATVRNCLSQAYGAQVVDHAGATEVGPWGVGNPQGNGIHVIESEFFAEFLPLAENPRETPTQVPQASTSNPQLYELVLTTLGRTGWPALRYRTGDLVRVSSPELCSAQLDCHSNVTSSGRFRASQFCFLPGGIVARGDEMWIVRGMNVFPSAIEDVLRKIDGIGEYRIVVARQGVLDEITIRVEDRCHQPERIANRLQQALGLRIQVEEVAAGSLERFEGKARRVIDDRLPNTD